MKRFLLWISVLLLGVLPMPAQGKASAATPWACHEGCITRYGLFMQAKGNGITGICILKQENGKLIGSVVNEFGIKAFDFSYDLKSKKMRLLNVVSFLDKWYIKKVIKGDWKYLFSGPAINRHDKNRKITCLEGGILVLENVKHQIKYTFTPFMQDNKNDHETIE